MGRKFYVLTTEKILGRDQKAEIRAHFNKKCSELPVIILDRGFKLSLVDESKGSIVSINDGNIKDIINGA